MAERLLLRLLGTFEAEADEQPVTHFEAASARALLAYLATHRKSPQMRSQLAALLWGIDVGHTGLTNLRSALRRVRNAVDSVHGEPSCLLTDRETVQLHPKLAVEVDTEQFEALFRSVKSHSHPSEYDCPECVGCYRQAVDLYRGLFLADLNLDTELFEQWRTALQDRYRRQVLHALFVLTEHEFRLGSLTAAETFARRQLEIEHWNEESHRQLMRVLLASGRRSAALAQYEACRQVLAAELGAVPSEETDALYARIVAGIAPPAPVQLYNPYKGLQPFAIADSLYFFGQEVMTDRLLAAVQEQSFVALIGASGSGKSSVIHAGLAASLASSLSRQQGFAGDVWCIASMRPGAAPLAALADSLLDCGYMPPPHSSLSELLHHDELALNAVAAALSSLTLVGKGENGVRRLLLIVDQFEEIFTLYGMIKLWDVATRRLVGKPLVGHSNRVTDLAFSPNGKVLASSSADSTIRYWNVDHGSQLDEPLTSGSQQVWTILPEPQNLGQLTALSGDGSIAWWNAARAELLRPLLLTYLGS